MPAGDSRAGQSLVRVVRCRDEDSPDAQGAALFAPPGASQHVGQELTPALNAEPAVQRRHVLVHGGWAESAPRRDLLFAVAFDETGKRLAQARRELVRSWLSRADELSSDEATELLVKELQQPHLAGREVALPELATERNRGNSPLVGQLAHGRHTVIEPGGLTRAT